MSSHNIPKALTFALATRTVGAWRVRVVLTGESVCPRGRDQDNPLRVSDDDPNGGTSRQREEGALVRLSRCRAELVTTHQIAAPDRHCEGDPNSVRHSLITLVAQPGSRSQCAPDCAPGSAPPEVRLAVRPRKDSNLRTRFRKPMLFPLSYGGVTHTSSE